MSGTKIRNIFLVLILCVTCIPTLALVPDMQFLQISKNFSHTTCESIIQDKQGFMWVGAAHGLNRFNGLDIDVYLHDPLDSTSISNNQIRKIAQDPDGNLWIATESGLDRYNIKTNKFTRYYFNPDNPNSIADNNVTDVLVDNQGNIWVAARDLCLYLPQSDSFKRYVNPAASLPDVDHYHDFIYQDHTEKIWFGCWRNLYKLPGMDSPLVLVFDGGAHPLGNEFWHLHEMTQDADNVYWVATNRAGLYRLNPDAAPHVMTRFNDRLSNNEYLSQYRLLTLFVDHQNNLWVSCENNGLVVFDKNRNSFKRFINKPDVEYSISGNSVWSIYQDNQNRIWFGTWNAGINVIDPNQSIIPYYHSKQGENSLTNDIITDFLEDPDGNIWISTDGGGLNYFNRKENKFIGFRHNPEDPNSISSNAVLCLSYDDKGNLWAGTWNGGINIYHKKENKFYHLNSTNSGLQSDHVFDLLNDNNGHIFTGTYKGGLSVYNTKTSGWTNWQTENSNYNSIQSNTIFNLYQDRDIKIWAGTLALGLAKYDTDAQGKARFIRYQHNPADTTSISDDRIHAMYQSPDKKFWVGTSNGLNYFDEKNNIFFKIPVTDNISGKYITGIQSDAYNNLWIACLDRLVKMDPNTLQTREIDAGAALRGVPFNKNASYKLSTGELLFGSAKGFILFHPDSIKTNPYAPPVVFTDLKIFNKTVPIGGSSPLKEPIGQTRHLELSWRHSVFTLEFRALNYTRPEKNQYAFMMEGFEKEWNYVGAQNSATYTNLDPGDYVFHVIAANNDGVWNKDGVTLAITINPPFWMTWWAFLVYGVTGIGLFYIIMTYRLRQQQLKHNLELEHYQLERLSETDKMKSRFFSNVSHEFRTPIMLIRGPLENLLKNKRLDAEFKGTLEMVIRNANRLFRLLNQLIHYYNIEAQEMNLDLQKLDIVQFVNEIVLSFVPFARQKQIEFNYTSNMKKGETWFDPDKLDKIVFNLLSNALKFTPEKGQVELQLLYKQNEQQTEKMIEIIVADTGIGIPQDQIEQIFNRFYQADNNPDSEGQGLGIGLHMARELVEQFNGRMTVVSEPGHGARFSVQLPVDTIELELKGKNIESGVKGKKPAPVTRTKSGFTPLPADQDASLVLVIDDDKDVLKYIHDLFYQSFRIITATNGREGLEKARNSIPDLIISDVNMPNMDGFELCRRLKTEERTSHIPVLLMTVQMEQEQKLKGIQSGADDYIPKPFNVEELYARMTNLLDTRKKLREQYKKQLLSGNRDSSTLSLDEQFLQRVKNAIIQNMNDWNFDAENLSGKVGVSRVQLYRKLKSLTGQTVHEFIRTLRLESAAQLLEKKKMNISEIAYHVGFNDLNYFSRCFRKHFGQSPSEYTTAKTNIKL